MADLIVPAPRAQLDSRWPFTVTARTGRPGSGVSLYAREDLGLATVQARKGRVTDFTRRVQEKFQIKPRHEPRRASSDMLAFLGIGPGVWLVTCEHSGQDFAASLHDVLADVASVADQSDGYAPIRVSGTRARDALCKLVAVDLHAVAFAVNRVAVTSAAHISLTLWRLEDEPATGHPVFEMTVPRSLAASFQHSLAAACAEFT